MYYLYIFLNKIILTFKFSFSFKGMNTIHQNFHSFTELVNDHFQKIEAIDHPCKESLELALSLLEDKDNIFIIETGSSAWGSNSTVLFDSYIVFKKRIGINCILHTCDLRINPALNLLKKVSKNTHLHCSDSIPFLKKMSKKYANEEFNFLIYLDSFDLNFDNPIPSGLHGFKEFLAIIPFLKKGTILLIDDTPIDIKSCPENVKETAQKFFEKNGIYPGKGMYVDPIIIKHGNIKKIYHKYQLLYLVV
jgi:hypothetical protein